MFLLATNLVIWNFCFAVYARLVMAASCVFVALMATPLVSALLLPAAAM